MKREKIIGLDFLKIISATLIVFHHYQQDFHSHFSGINFYGGRYYFGNLVELFFIISGFLTLYTCKGERYLHELRHKLIRIYPVPFVACLYTILIESLTLFLTNSKAELLSLWNLRTLFVNFFLLFSGWRPFAMMGINNPTWYLCVLIQCYLLFYALQYIKEKLKTDQLLLCATAIIASVILNKFKIIEGDTYRGIESFFLGVVLCEILENRLKTTVAAKKQLNMFFLCTASAGCIITICLLYRYPLLQRFILLFGLFPCMLVIVYCLHLKDNYYVRKLGQISFEVFIWHYPLIATEKMILKLFDINDFNRGYGSMILFTGITWIISIFLYKYLEIPIQKKLHIMEP